jgi:peptidoglycan/xylan/chitin deacetylase (PgdA/CDA1 family)
MVVDNIKKLEKTLKSKYTSIYLFHGVIKNKLKSSSVRNYNNKHLIKKKFENYIKYLSLNGHAISLNNISKNKNLKNKFIITFDDGFYNNYKIALPILKKYRVPHIIYITSNYVDKNLISWIDRVDIAIDKTKKKEIYSKILKKKFKINNKKNKIKFLNYTRNYCKSLKKKDLNKFTNKLLKDINLTSPLKSNNDLDKKLDWKSIIKMNKDKLTEFGGHSHNHNILGHLDEKTWKNEIINNLKFIENKAMIKVKHYSFPEGFESSFNNKMIKFLKQKGIKTSVTTLTKKENINNPYKLNRFFVV